jgi:uncharacterized membrane protein
VIADPPTASPRRWRDLVKVAVGVLLLGYPVGIYFAEGHFTPGELAAGLLALLAARVLVSGWIVRRHVRRKIALALFLVIAAVVVWRIGEVRMRWLRFYPTLFDFAVWALFFGSLFTQRPLIERIARVFEPDLPPAGVRYTRRVTQVWSVIMGAITLASLYLAIGGPLRWWSLFNGVIVYGVIGMTFGCEYLVRQRVRRRWGRA